jgi:hypothetical protein
MADIPCDTQDIIERFGPHPAWSSGLRLQTVSSPIDWSTHTVASADNNAAFNLR